MYQSPYLSSPGSAPFTLHQFLEIIPIHVEFLQFIIPFSTIVFHHQHIYHNLFSHSPIEGHSLIFQFFANTKSAAINIFAQFIFPMISLGYKCKSGMAGSKGRQFFYSPTRHSSKLPYRMVGSIHNSTSSALMYQFCHILSNILHFPLLSY